MADITASLVKQLRDKTGAGMMDAKNALVECDGDIETAVDWLRKKGLAKAAKKSGRTAADGLVVIAVSDDGKTGSVVEINAETDFVARNEQFQGFARKVAEIALSSVANDVESLSDANYGDGKTVQETLTGLIATIGENMALRRVQTLSVPNGAVCAYMHNALAPNLGKIGVLVAISSTGSQAPLQAAGKQIAMHVAAANPEFLTVASVSTDALEREKDVLREQARATGKPDDIIEKMLEGRLRKYYEEVVLLEQLFVMDGKTKVSQFLQDSAKECGAPAELTGYARFQLGEGIEKEEEDFAAEVAKTVNG